MSAAVGAESAPAPAAAINRALGLVFLFGGLLGGASPITIATSRPRGTCSASS